MRQVRNLPLLASIVGAEIYTCLDEKSKHEQLLSIFHNGKPLGLKSRAWTVHISLVTLLRPDVTIPQMLLKSHKCDGVWFYRDSHTSMVEYKFGI